MSSLRKGTGMETKQYKLIVRSVVYVVGALILALGVVLNTKCMLGISTTNSVPNVLNVVVNEYGISWMTLGWACNIIYVIDIVFQCIVYRKIKLKVLLQLPFSFVFGRVVDVYVGMLKATGMLDSTTAALLNPTLPLQILLLVLGIVFTAVGIAMVVNMDFVPNPPDGGVQALTQLTKLPFGRAKILWDGILLAVTCIVSLIFTKNHIIVGIGIGTVVAFFVIGNIISWVNKHFGTWFTSIYDKNAVTGNVPAKNQVPQN